jgi:hypothetical protein
MEYKELHLDRSMVIWVPDIGVKIFRTRLGKQRSSQRRRKTQCSTGSGERVATDSLLGIQRFEIEFRKGDSRMRQCPNVLWRSSVGGRWLDIIDGGERMCKGNGGKKGHSMLGNNDGMQWRRGCC